MALARRTLKKALMEALSIASHSVVSHVQGMVTVSLATEDFLLTSILEVVQGAGFTPVVLKLGTVATFSYVTFATTETVAQMGQGGHGGAADSMSQDLQDLFTAGGLGPDGLPVAEAPAPRRNRRGNNRQAPVSA